MQRIDTAVFKTVFQKEGREQTKLMELEKMSDMDAHSFH